jgi:hypothetical protein
MSSGWVDVHGNPWRFSKMTRAWQRLVDNAWITSTPPSGGLQRSGVAGSGNVVVLETGGPPGEPGPPGPPGSGLAVAEVLSDEYQDGVNDTFPLSIPADLSQAVQVFRNGLMEIQGHGYLMTSMHVIFTTPPLDSDVLTVVYQKAQ